MDWPTTWSRSTTRLATADLLRASEVTTELVEGAGHNDLMLVDPGPDIEAIARLIERAQG